MGISRCSLEEFCSCLWRLVRRDEILSCAVELVSEAMDGVDSMLARDAVWEIERSSHGVEGMPSSPVACSLEPSRPKICESERERRDSKRDSR